MLRGQVLKNLFAKRPVKAYTTEGNEFAEIYSIRRDRSRLVIDGKALGVMRMDIVVTLDEFLNGLRLILCWDVISFILLLPFFMLRRLLGKS